MSVNHFAPITNDTPSQLDHLIQNGQPQFGVFQSVGHINYLDYHLYQQSFLLPQKRLPNWLKQLKANQFAYIYLVHPPYRIGIAIASIKLASTAFVIIYNEDTQHLEVTEALQPLTHQTTLTGDHNSGKMAFCHKALSVELQFHLDNVTLNVNSDTFAISATGKRHIAPLAVCTPAGRRGWTFTQKQPFTHVDGSINFKNTANKKAPHHQNNSLSFDQNTLMHMDWTLGYMRHVTNWFWACINTYLPAQSVQRSEHMNNDIGINNRGKQNSLSKINHSNECHFALNLAMGVNETGVCENACWVDGQIYYLPPVLFIRPEIMTNDDKKLPWQIGHQNLGWSNVIIDLTFTPITAYCRDEDFGVVANQFEQWLGYYSGTIEVAGQRIVLDKVMGLAEDHLAKW